MWKIVIILGCFAYYVKCYTLPPGEEDLAFYKHSLAKSYSKNCTASSSSSDGDEKVCCKGFAQHPYDPTQCVAVCEKKCFGGYCSEPGICKCFQHGFVEIANGTCLRTCPDSCFNGRCTGPGNNTCHCYNGYRLSRDSKYCEPICSFPCGENEECSAPEQCGCQWGYELIEGSCRPTCREDCLNGICIAPNKCSCFPGYVLKDNVCQANCWQGCENGRCIKPNECHCNIGFGLALSTLQCTPICEKCYLGNCVEPGKCVCPHGYQYSGYDCKPDCKGACLNGRCISPGRCLCKDDYGFALKSGNCRKWRCTPFRKCEKPMF